jgi:hypothetical protein
MTRITTPSNPFIQGSEASESITRIATPGHPFTQGTAVHSKHHDAGHQSIQGIAVHFVPMDISPFVQLRGYPFVVCTTCEFPCVGGQVATHLRKYHATIPSDKRQKITKDIQAIPGIVVNQADLVGFQYPPPTVDPIPFIARPRKDGLRCNECSFIVRTYQGIQRHCRERHGWVNDWQKGGDVAKRAKQQRVCPWTTGVRCQRFFRSHAASQWFEVGRHSEGQHVADAAEPERTETEDTARAKMEELEDQRILQAHRIQAQRFDARMRQLIQMETKRLSRTRGWIGSGRRSICKD